MRQQFRLLLAVLLCLAAWPAAGQQTTSPAATSAETAAYPYHALYVLNRGDDRSIRGMLRNIQNALNDPRLKGKLSVEVIAFGDGVALYQTVNHYDSLLLPLRAQGVSFVECLNTMEKRKIKKTDLYDFVTYVPSGNGEIILRQHQGWAIVFP